MYKKLDNIMERFSSYDFNFKTGMDSIVYSTRKINF